MSALAQERPGRVEKIKRFKGKLAANVKAWKGGACVLDPSVGYYKPAVVGTGLIERGRFKETKSNIGGAAGAVEVEIELEREITVIWWDNDTGTACVATDRGKDVYFTSDHEVTTASSGKSKAGRMFDLASDGRVIVEVLP